jgi:kinesin family protein 6/9
MTYGQTGSGKTFTMMGDAQSYRNRGILPRAVAHVFSHAASKPEREYAIYISYMEIYGEQIRDLLVEGNALNGTTPGSAEALGLTVSKSGQVTGQGGSALAYGEFNIGEDPIHGVVVRGLTLVPVESEADILTAVYQAEMARTTAHHHLNRTSSRAHSIFTIHIQQRSRLGGGREKIVSSKLIFVDLAGSERIKKSLGSGTMAEGNDAILQRESMVINRSLSYLEACVVALSNANRTHVPYKNARLTQVLKDVLGGKCNTTLVACIWGEARHLEECISTLKFAQRMMAVKIPITEEQTYIDPEAMLIKLQKEVSQLKQELLMHDALADRTGIQYSDYTPEQQAQLAQKVKAFVAAKTDEQEASALPFESVAQMREALRQAKALIKHAAVEAEERLQQQYNLVRKGDTAHAQTLAAETSGIHDSSHSRNHSGNAGVGELDASISGVGLGLASAGSRPHTVQLPQSIADRMNGTSTLGSVSSPSRGGFSSTTSSSSHAGEMSTGLHSPLKRTAGFGAHTGPMKALDLNGAWQQFKGTPTLGAEYAAEVTSLKRKLQTFKDEASMCVRTCNESKVRIETLVKKLIDLAHAPLVDKPSSIPDRIPSAGKARPSGGSTKGSVVPDPSQDSSADLEAKKAEREAETKKMNHDLAETKKAYRSATERLAIVKETILTVQDQISVQMAAMVRDFETWYASMTGRLPPIPVSPTRDRSGSPFKSGKRQQGFGETAIYDWSMTAGNNTGSRDDQLDDQEAFEAMEMTKVTVGEPDSYAFFGATRHIRQGVKPTGGKRQVAR